MINGFLPAFQLRASLHPGAAGPAAYKARTEEGRLALRAKPNTPS